MIKPIINTVSNTNSMPDSSSDIAVGAKGGLLTMIDRITNTLVHPASNKKPAIKEHPVNSMTELNISLTPNEIVPVGEYKIIKGHSEPLCYLFSFDAEDSVMISVFSPEKNYIALYHINDETLLDNNLTRFLEEIDDTANSGTWKVTMAGGQWLTGSGLGSKIKTLLQTKYNITPEWNKWSWSGCNVKRYGMLLNVQTCEQTLFEHTKQFANDLNRDILRQLREKNSITNDMSKDDKYNIAIYDFRTLSIDKDREVIERHSFNGITYCLSAAGVRAREQIDSFVQKLNEYQIAMLSNTRKEQIAKIKELHQQLSIHNVIDLYIEKNKQSRQTEDDSFNTYSTDISASRSSSCFSRSSYETHSTVSEKTERAEHFSGFFRDQKKKVTDQPHRWAGKVTNSKGSARVSRSSHETRSTAISEKKERAEQFNVVTSAIFRDQKKNFTDRQHKLAEKAIEELASGRQHKSSHPMEESRFSSSVLSKLKQEFPQIMPKKFYSRDLGDWEETGKGRGVWRIVSVRNPDNELIIAGVFNNHKNPYKLWQ